MKLIDEKGRLFGKVNIVDFLILALIVAIIPAFVYTYKILGKTPIPVSYTWVKVEAVVFTIPEVVRLIKPGDISFDEFGNTDARLVKILKKDDAYAQRIKNSMIKQLNKVGKVYEIDTRYAYRVPLFLELELPCAKNPPQQSWHFRRRPLIAGMISYFTFTTDKYRLMCYPIRVDY